MVSSLSPLRMKIDDRVFVRDQKYEWLPAVVQEVEEDRVLVRIELPNDWDKTTVEIAVDPREEEEGDDDAPIPPPLHQQLRWVELRDYYNHRLPLQNNEITEHTTCRGGDMAELKHVHEAALLYEVKERHCNLDRPYTRVGGDILVAVNPCHWIPGLYSRDQQRFYFEKFGKAKQPMSSGTHFEEKKDDGEGFVAYGSAKERERLDCEPHVYEVSSLAFRGVSTDHQNQTILVSGESGAGKTESVKLVLQHLASLRQDKVSAGGNSEDDLVHHLLESSSIFEAFGNAKTPLNKNSSRFGKVTKLQYFAEKNGASLIGSSFDTYMLETSRVVSQVEGGRNFHIFYQMLSAPQELKQELLGPDWGEATAVDFRYLNGSGDPNVSGLDDATLWSQTLKAMDLFGWEGTMLQNLTRALGAVLLIGNIEFVEDIADAGKASIASHADLNMLVQILGISIDEMEQALTRRFVNTAQDKHFVPYNIDQARDARDSLAKAIYACIFDSIVHKINLSTSMPPQTVTENHKSILLVDIFGFESFDVNRFEQFCINYASERLQYKYVRDTLDRYTIEYEAEGIEVPDWKEIDNTETILLFEGKSGLIRTLNEQTVRSNGTNEVFVFKAKSSNKGHASLIDKKLPLPTRFGVRHFAGPVTYDAAEFIERNVDKLPDFLVSVAAKSSNELIGEQLGELLKDRGDNSSLKVVQKRVTHRTVVQNFCKQLRELLISIDSSQARYIRCIKPCHEVEITKRIDHQTVLRQIRCAGLVTAIELSRDTFPNKLPFSAVESRFGCLMPGVIRHSIKDMEAHDKAQVLMSALFAPLIQQYRGSDFAMPFACGHTKVYFRAGALEELETLREVRIHSAALRIQYFLQMAVQKQRFRRLTKGFVMLQAHGRCRAQALQYSQKREAAVKIQTQVRRAISQSRYILMKESALEIELWARSVLLRLRYRQLKTAANRINAWSRMQIHRRRYTTLVRSVTAIQACTRGRTQLECFRETRRAQGVLSHWWKAVISKMHYCRMKDAAAIMTVWSHSRIGRLRYCRLLLAVTALQARVRTQKHSQNYASQRQAAQTITRWSHSILVRRSFNHIRVASNVISAWVRSRTQRAIFMKRKCASTVLTSWFRSQRESARYRDLQKAAALICLQRRSRANHQLLVKKNSAARKIQTVAREHIQKNRSTLVDRVEQYKKQIRELNQDITTVTTEAALHLEEVEAEYEERLGEYEDEVLLLQQTIERNEAEKLDLKDEIAANVENVGNLKMGIQSMQESHREYLNKVMRAVEKANADHAKALEKVKRDRDIRVEELKAEIKMMKEGNDPATQKRKYDVTRLARKLESLIAPDYITAMAEKAGANGMTTVDCVEQKVSSKARKIIYRLEDIASAVPVHCFSTRVEEQSNKEKDRCIEDLQQKLVRAYEEIERLENDATRSSSGPKRGFRSRVFHR